MFAQNTNFDALLILYSQPNWNNHSSHHMNEIKNMKAVCVCIRILEIASHARINNMIFLTAKSKGM